MNLSNGCKLSSMRAPLDVGQLAGPLVGERPARQCRSQTVRRERGAPAKEGEGHFRKLSQREYEGPRNVNDARQRTQFLAKRLVLRRRLVADEVDDLAAR